MSRCYTMIRGIPHRPITISLIVNTVRVENFEGGKFRAFQILPYLEIFAGINSTFQRIIFVLSATHEKREIKNTSKFSTRTVSLSTMNNNQWFDIVIIMVIPRSKTLHLLMCSWYIIDTRTRPPSIHLTAHTVKNSMT